MPSTRWKNQGLIRRQDLRRRQDRRLQDLIQIHYPILRPIQNQRSIPIPRQRSIPIRRQRSIPNQCSIPIRHQHSIPNYQFPARCHLKPYPYQILMPTQYSTYQILKPIQYPARYLEPYRHLPYQILKPTRYLALYLESYQRLLLPSSTFLSIHQPSAWMLPEDLEKDLSGRCFPTSWLKVASLHTTSTCFVAA